MKLFAQMTKVDAERRIVYGRAVQETPDRSDEIFDYASSKPYFEAWSKAFAADTDGKSLGNLRAMHGKVAAGKLVDITFNDAEKAIDIAAKVVDDQEWAKVLEGVYTGYSIGGSYVQGSRKTEKVDGRDLTRYTADPNEISLVDAPCIPTAKFFDVLKANGAVEKVAFKPAEVVLEVTGTDEEVADFAKALNDSKLTMADAIALVKAAKPADPPVEKGMWNVQDFARVLGDVASIARSSQWDLEDEGDDSPVPAKLRDWLKSGVEIFKGMAAEEAAELIAELSAAAGEGDDMVAMAARVGDLQKRLQDPALTMADFVKIAGEHLTAEELAKVTAATIPDAIVAIVAKASAKMTGANKDRLQAAHDHLASMGATCATKEAAAPAGDLTKAAPDLAKVQADLAAALERIKTLEAQPMPHPGLVQLRTVAKGDPVAGAVDKTAASPALFLLEKSDYVYNADGSVDWATSRAQKAFKTGLAAV